MQKKRQHNHFSIISLFLLMLSNAVTAAGVYKWIDADGVIHYGDRPSPDAVQMRVKNRPEADPGLSQRNEKRNRLLNVLKEERQEKHEQIMLLAKDKAERKERCLKAQEKLDQYQTAGFLYRLDEQGNRNVLGEDEHKQAVEMAKNEVSDWCS